ncbi:hypothetical protein SDC9_202062 [bioreactor metagenome]|uniref:Uncharacterized protein n=1 Tax=bioreactor metagenome TaxID=1076179 RepID=A0A645IU72_9ZZZZ
MEDGKADRGFISHIAFDQVNHSLNGLGGGDDALDGVDLAIADGQNGFDLEGGTKKTLRPADTSASVQILEGVHREVNANGIVGTDGDLFTFFQAGAFFGSAGSAEHLKAQCHGDKPGIHHFDGIIFKRFLGGKSRED